MAKTAKAKEQNETKEIEVPKEEVKPVGKKEVVEFTSPIYPGLTLFLEVPISPKMANTLRVNPSKGLKIKFTNGVYKTSDPKEIALIKETLSFKNGDILIMD